MPTCISDANGARSGRVVYVGLIRLAGTFTSSIADAAHVVSAFFAALSTIVVGLLLRHRSVPSFALPLIAPACGLVGIARVATPDSLACFGSLALALLMATGAQWPVYGMIIFLPLLRTDYVIFSVLAALYMAHFDNKSRAGLAAALAILLYELVGVAKDSLGYFTLLHFTFIDTSPYPANLKVSFNLHDYVGPIAMSTNYFISDGLFLLFGIGLAVLWMRSAEIGKDRNLALFVALPSAFILCHFALFPHYDNRFLVSSFLLLSIGVIGQFRQLESKQPGNDNKASGTP